MACRGSFATIQTPPAARFSPTVRGDGSRLATRLVEDLVLSDDGRFAARFGWSTPS